jgi:hypothetical protein
MEFNSKIPNGASGYSTRKISLTMVAEYVPKGNLEVTIRFRFMPIALVTRLGIAVGRAVCRLQKH